MTTSTEDSFRSQHGVVHTGAPRAEVAVQPRLPAEVPQMPQTPRLARLACQVSRPIQPVAQTKVRPLRIPAHTPQRDLRECLGGRRPRRGKDEGNLHGCEDVKYPPLPPGGP